MIEIRENAIAIVHQGLGCSGDEFEELEISNWNTQWVPMIRIKTITGMSSMEFNVDEFIAIAEILKQLKEHRR